MMEKIYKRKSFKQNHLGKKNKNKMVLPKNLEEKLALQDLTKP